MILEVIFGGELPQLRFLIWPGKHRIKNAIPIRSGTGNGVGFEWENVILTKKQYFCKSFPPGSFLLLLRAISSSFHFNPVQCDVFGASGYFYLLAVEVFALRALLWLREAAPPPLRLLGTNPPWLWGILFTSALNSLQVRKYKSMILEDLESALAEHAPAPQEVNSELPPLTIDGIPVSVDKMTQVRGRQWGGDRDKGPGCGRARIALLSFVLGDTCERDTGWSLMAGRRQPSGRDCSVRRCSHLRAWMWSSPWLAVLSFHLGPWLR